MFQGACFRVKNVEDRNVDASFGMETCAEKQNTKNAFLRCSHPIPICF